MTTSQPPIINARPSRRAPVRIVGPLAALVVAAGLLAGCGGGASSNRAAPDSNPDPSRAIDRPTDAEAGLVDDRSAVAGSAQEERRYDSAPGYGADEDSTQEDIAATSDPDDTSDTDDTSDAASSAAGPVGSGPSNAGDGDGREGFFEPAQPDEVVPDDGRDGGETTSGLVRSFVDTRDDPVSTFALDVDTGSFTLARRWLDDGRLPPADTVRVEEYVNAFDYDYPAPRRGLAVSAEGGPSPFGTRPGLATEPSADRVLLRLGVQAATPRSRRPEAALTFIVDTSGSMDRRDRLGLVKESLRTLVGELSGDDSVAIVTYGDRAEVVLAPTGVDDRDRILDAIDDLRPDGSTNLEAGLYRGYDLAAESFIDGGINRVVLASDGVANVGLTDPDTLADTIRNDADRGIQLVTLGVGMGSYNDALMEQLADQGDGFYAYIDDRDEADRLFGDELLSTLLTVAVDAKIQVDFEPEVVQSYRLIGFENRAVLDRDFRNDAVDAGELGAGHQVTALYELALYPGVESNETLGTARLRWQEPGSGSSWMGDPIPDEILENELVLTADLIEPRWERTGRDFRLAVTVAALAEVLRHSPYADGVDLDQIRAEAESLSGDPALDDLLAMIDQVDRLR